MPKRKTLSGNDLLRIFSTFGFHPVLQHGSHVKLRRILENGERQILTVPMHRELDKGTLRAILRQALRFLSESDARPHFYSAD